MNMAPKERARELVAGIASDWGRITKGDINLRRELLEVLCTHTGVNGKVLLQPGLPGLYLFGCARSGDQIAYDILKQIGAALDFARPKAPGGIDKNAARDFVVDLLSTVLLIEFPELCPSANDATPEGVSAVDLIRKEIEDAGLACIDYKASAESEPVPRSMERAVRRFRDKEKYRELFWPEVDDGKESCHTQSKAVLRNGVCTETPSYGGTNDQAGTTSLDLAAHDPVTITPICHDEEGEIP